MYFQALLLGIQIFTLNCIVFLKSWSFCHYEMKIYIIPSNNIPCSESKLILIWPWNFRPFFSKCCDSCLSSLLGNPIIHMWNCLVLSTAHWSSGILYFSSLPFGLFLLLHIQTHRSLFPRSDNWMYFVKKLLSRRATEKAFL